MKCLQGVGRLSLGSFHTKVPIHAVKQTNKQAKIIISNAPLTYIFYIKGTVHKTSRI